MKIIWIFSFYAISLLAETYAYHPSNALHLGAGFDPAYPERAFQSCVEFEGRKNVDGQAAIKTEYSLSLIKSKKELFDKLGISASFSARGLFWQASAGVDYFSEHRFHSDSISWMLLGKSEYGRFILENPRLNSAAQKLLDVGDTESFAKRCGTAFIKQERRSALIAAVFSMENVSQQDIRRLETYFQASVSAGFFEANAQTKYARFITEANQISRIHLSVYAVGGAGITELSHLVLHPDNLIEIQKVLEGYMRGLHESQAVPIEYVSGSMAAFGWEGPSPAKLFKRERTLAELYYRYEQTHSTYKRLEALINMVFINKTEYQPLYQAYSDYIEVLLNAADACHNASAQCQLPANTLPIVNWPVNALSRCDRLRFQAYEKNLINSEEFIDLQRFNMVPLIDPLAKRIGAYAFCKNLT